MFKVSISHLASTADKWYNFGMREYYLAIFFKCPYDKDGDAEVDKKTEVGRFSIVVERTEDAIETARRKMRAMSKEGCNYFMLFDLVTSETIDEK